MEFEKKWGLVQFYQNHCCAGSRNQQLWNVGMEDAGCAELCFPALANTACCVLWRHPDHHCRSTDFPLETSPKTNGAKDLGSTVVLLLAQEGAAGPKSPCAANDKSWNGLGLEIIQFRPLCHGRKHLWLEQVPPKVRWSHSKNICWEWGERPFFAF